MITGINNDECHVREKAANISKRSVRIWPAIVPAGHYRQGSLQCNPRYLVSVVEQFQCFSINLVQFIQDISEMIEICDLIFSFQNQLFNLAKAGVYLAPKVSLYVKGKFLFQYLKLVFQSGRSGYFDI